VVLPQIIGGGLGAIQGGMQGGLKGALLGGALGAALPGVGGALGTRLAGTKLGLALGKGVSGGLRAGGRNVAKGVSGLGEKGIQGLTRTGGEQLASLMRGGAGQAVGATGLGGLGTAAYFGLGSPGLGAVAGMGSRAIDRAVGGGSGIIGYNSVTGEPITAAGAAVPPGLGQYGGTNMYGSNPYDVIDPSGAMSANRLMQLKQAETNARMLDTIAGTQMKWTEETKRRDLERQLAAAGIRQNILTQANMLQAANTAGLTQGTNAMQQVGGALTNNYSYS
tara:strand:- start:650 stop:1486 length:837 start_codon:yes stop_codon:yes gene_type:complete